MEPFYVSKCSSEQEKKMFIYSAALDCKMLHTDITSSHRTHKTFLCDLKVIQAFSVCPVELEHCDNDHNTMSAL